MKKQSKVLSAVLTVALAISMTSVCFAEGKTFEKRSVDSNTFVSVTGYTKTQTSGTADVKITEIYKADGSASNYKKVYAKVNRDGAEKSIEKGTEDILDIPANAQGKGTVIFLYCKGNNPSLDCQVSGWFDGH